MLVDRKQEINKLEKEVTELAGITIRIKEVKLLLNEHIYWTNFFNFLEDNTLDDIYYEDFNGGLSGLYTLNTAALNFDSFINQMDIWQKEEEYTKSISIDGYQTEVEMSSEQEEEEEIEGEVIEESRETQASQSTINFTMGLEISPNIFYK